MTAFAKLVRAASSGTTIEDFYFLEHYEEPVSHRNPGFES